MIVLFCASVKGVYGVIANSGKIGASSDSAGAMETYNFLVWSYTNRICLMFSGNFDLALCKGVCTCHEPCKYSSN